MPDIYKTDTCFCDVQVGLLYCWSGKDCFLTNIERSWQFLWCLKINHAKNNQFCDIPPNFFAISMKKKNTHFSDKHSAKFPISPVQIFLGAWCQHRLKPRKVLGTMFVNDVITVRGLLVFLNRYFVHSNRNHTYDGNAVIYSKRAVLYKQSIIFRTECYHIMPAIVSAIFGTWSWSGYGLFWVCKLCK